MEKDESAKGPEQELSGEEESQETVASQKPIKWSFKNRVVNCQISCKVKKTKWKICVFVLIKKSLVIFVRAVS